MIISINQPAYLPWLGYYHRIALSDAFVFLDHVQFEKNSFINRNKIRIIDGSTWLSIPVKTSGRFGNLAISNVEILNNGWQKKHLAGIRMNYAKAPFFDFYFPEIEKLLQQEYILLAPFLFDMNTLFLKWLGIQTKVIRSSDLELQEKKSDLILEICRKLEAKTYFSGKMGINYLELPKFESSGILVKFQDYKHPVYTQRFPGFEPYMGVLDLLMNHGDQSLPIILAQKSVDYGT